MICDPATAADFSRWRAHARTCDDQSLRFIIADCRSAARNMRDWNPVREGYYIDQALTYSDELRRRIQSGRSSCPTQSGRIPCCNRLPFS